MTRYEMNLMEQFTVNGLAFSDMTADPAQICSSMYSQFHLLQ